MVAAIALASSALYFVSGAGKNEAATYGPLVNYAVVQGQGTSEIALVNAYDDTIAGRIDLLVQPDQVLISNAVERIIFSSRKNKTVSTFDLAAQKVDAIFELPFSPDSIVLSPDGLTLVAADVNEGLVGIIKLAEATLLPVVSGFTHPANLSFDNDSSFVLIPDSAANEIKVLDTSSGLGLDPIKVSVSETGGAGNGETLSAVTRTISGLYGLSVDKNSSRMSIINFRQWAESKTINLGKNPTRPYGTSDGRLMLVANNEDRTISIFSTEYFDLEATLPGVSDVTSIVTGYLETLAFVVSASEKKAVVVDLTDMTVEGEIKFDGTPGPAVVTADGLKLFVALTDTNQVAVVDVRQRRVEKTIKDIGQSPVGVILALTNNYCH